MRINPDPPIGHLIRTARQRLQISQYELADKLAAVSGKATMGRDRVARWERGRQVPRDEWRQWLSVVLEIPKPMLDAGAAAARRRNQLGHAAVTANPPVGSPAPRRNQGTPALLPVFRSRVQAGILAATLMNPNRAFSLTELADHAGGSLASVSKESDILEAAGILARRNNGTVRLVRVVKDRPIVGPLTQLIRATYGVPQVLAEELGRVPGITRITVAGPWGERFAGLPGVDPATIQLKLSVPDRAVLDEDELTAAVDRAQKRVLHEIRYTLVSAENADWNADASIPRQRDWRPVVNIAILPPRAGQASIVQPTQEGKKVIDSLIEDGELELMGGPDADDAQYFSLAAEHLDAAEQIAQSAPGSAFLLVCTSAQLIGVGLLARQGIRPAAGAAPDVIGRAVSAQFGMQFWQIELLRQRALQMATPTSRDNRAARSDVDDYLPTARSLLSTAQDLVPAVSLFA